MKFLVLLIKFSSIFASFRVSDSVIGNNFTVTTIRTKDKTVTKSLIKGNSDDDFSCFECFLKSGLLMVCPWCLGLMIGRFLKREFV